LAAVVCLAFSAQGRGVTISLIDLPTRTIKTTFPACLDPQAVVWAPAPAGGGGACTCDDHEASDRGKEGDPHDDDPDDGDRCDCECDRHDDGDRDDGHHRAHDRSWKDRAHDDDENECRGGPPPVSNTAYAVCEPESTLIKIDLSGAIPVVTTAYPLVSAMRPGALAIDPSGTHALVVGEGHDLSYVDLTKTPYTETPVSVLPPSPSTVAFYGPTKAVIGTDSTFTGNALNFVDLSTTPPARQVLPLPPGQEAVMVAVDPAGTRAAVTLDSGGVLVVDLTTTPPSFVGGPVGPRGDALGVAVSPDGTVAIAAYETLPQAAAVVVNISGTPSANTPVPLSSPLGSPSAVAFNPVNREALVAGDDFLAFLQPPYTTVFYQLAYPPGVSGATKQSVAASPDGTRALVLNEDSPDFAVAAVVPQTGPAAGGTAVTITGGPFKAGATVTFDAAPATSVVVVDAATITAVTPAHAGGAVDVAVTQPGSSSTLSAGFSYISVPVVLRPRLAR
jgi:hypothetical protein